MMKKLLWTLFFSLIAITSYADTQITWSKVYGGSSTEYFQDICPTSDGGYIATGWTMSYGRGQDVWVVKLDSYGSILWQKAYGTSANEEARTPHSIQQVSDGGYIVAANSGSDCWMLKLDSAGEVEWQKKYGGTGTEFIWAVQNTDDGGFIVIGTTFTFVSGGGADAWILRLDDSGNVIWEKSYGGSGVFEMAFAVNQTFDGGFIVSAYTYAWSTTSYFSAWVLKLYANGEIEWQKAYGGGGERQGDFFNFVSQTSDGSYILTGNTMSWSPGPYNSYDHTNLWAMKLDGSGNVLWSKAYGGSDLKANGGSCIEEITDGNYIISGLTRSFGNSSTENLYDLWVLKTDPNGQILWEKAYGGNKEDGQCRNGSSIRQASDDGFILSSDTASFSSGGTTDAWALKLDAEGNISGGDSFITDTSATVTNITDLVTVVSNAVPMVTSSTVTNTYVTPTLTTAVPVSLVITDSDGDSVLNGDDNCPDDSNPGQEDADEDGLGDACDNCPDDSNYDQQDTCEDGTGDACRDNTDNDTFPDACDNCPDDFNPLQGDIDNNGIGNICEEGPPCYVHVEISSDPYEATEALDNDCNGIDDTLECPVGTVWNGASCVECIDDTDCGDLYTCATSNICVTFPLTSSVTEVTLKGPGDLDVIFELNEIDIARIELTGTTEDSSLTIKTKLKKNFVYLSELDVAGSLKSIKAKAVVLTGALTATGGIAKIQIAGTEAGSSIEAEWIDKLTIKGDFAGHVDLTGEETSRKGYTLGKASIKGSLLNSIWQVSGDVGSVKVGAWGAGSILAVGVEPGNDGQFFTNDDVVSGGSLGKVKFKYYDTDNGGDPFGIISDDYLKLKTLLPVEEDDFYIWER